MSDANIALNRFGLGARPDEAAPADPRRWLSAQFERYEAKPAALGAVPTRRKIAGELADFYEMQRGQQGQRARRQPAAAPAMAATPDPTMAGTKGAAAAAADIADAADPVAQARRYARQQGRDAYAVAVGARANIALTTPAPFVERLVHFWANHFAISIDKLTVVGLGGLLEFEAIRPHVLGKFGDMLLAVERHPAMLLYLDQAQSVGPGSALGSRAGRYNPNRKVGLNENLAREILELHTLGVRTGYAQADVTEFARAMTGWSVAGISRGPGARIAGTLGEPGDFVFAERIHEPGERTIIGKRYGQEGAGQAEAVLRDLAVHPATAKHIATKLARHFAGDEPPPALIVRLEQAFLTSGGDLPSVYRALIAAPEPWVAAPVKFKTPWEWSVATWRALGLKQVQPLPTVGLLNQLGQPVWRPGSPAGWDDVGPSWAGPDAIMRRVEAAERFATRAPQVDARALAPRLFPAALSPATSQQLARAESPGQALALLLVAPEAMRR
ncbi:MAG: DUF1800 domain-containing protein [Pseudomonadota bacterium]